MSLLRSFFAIMLAGTIDGSRDLKEFHWVGPNGYIWGDNQCSNLGDLPGKSLHECKVACGSNEFCTAINHNTISNHCSLRKCTLPVLAPHGNGGNGASGYHLRKSGLVTCHSNEAMQVVDGGTQLCETGATEVTGSDMPQPHSFWWDKFLPRFDGCWAGMDNGRFKEFKFGVKLTAGWTSHFSAHQADFNRHGYKTVEESPRIVLDPVSYLFEQQFGIRLVLGKVLTSDAQVDPWEQGYAGILVLDTKGTPHAPVNGVCSKNHEILGTGQAVISESGELLFRPMFGLAHELAHFLGSPHTPAYKPDIMVVDGRPTYRRCNGKPCMYRHFLPWTDGTSYQKSICHNARQASCSALSAPVEWNPWKLVHDSTFCSQDNLDMSNHAAQCYKHKDKDGWSSSYESNSNALCLSAYDCKALCISRSDCHSVDMHKGKNRCYLNGFSCNEFITDTNYVLFVKLIADPERNHWIVHDSTFCSLANLDMSNHAAQCYKHKDKDGWSSSYGSDSNALCLSEYDCKALCISRNDCHSVDMHKGKPRCYLNSFSCNEFETDSNYVLLVKSIAGPKPVKSGQALRR